MYTRTDAIVSCGCHQAYMTLGPRDEFAWHIIIEFSVLHQLAILYTRCTQYGKDIQDTSLDK